MTAEEIREIEEDKGFHEELIEQYGDKFPEFFEIEEDMGFEFFED